MKETVDGKNAGSIKILMVDDQKTVLAGLAKLVSSLNPKHVVGTASDAREAIEIVREHNPHFVFIDVDMPGMNGVEATRRISRLAPETKIIALSVQKEYPIPRMMMDAGAACYLSKDVDEDEIQQALTMAGKNEEYVSREVAQNMALHTFSKWQNTPFSMLSSRELQIAHMVFNSMSVGSIADQLSLSPKTVNSYRYRIFNKLHIKSDMHLAILAVRFSLLNVHKVNIGSHRAVGNLP